MWGIALQGTCGLFWRVALAYSLYRVLRQGRSRFLNPAEGRRNNMQTVVLCSQCDQPESKCSCDRYCCYCKGLEGIRLCVDGQYYCPDCREACDIHVAETHD